MASKDPKMSEQRPAGKRRYITLTVPYKSETIRSPESSKS
jgi:hypothetical protein